MSLFTNEMTKDLEEQDVDLSSPSDTMRVKKRDGRLVSVHPEMITKAVARHCHGLYYVDCDKVADKVIRGLYDGVSTLELDQLLIQTASMMIGEEPEYSKLAARLLNWFIEDEVRSLGVRTFSESIAFGVDVGLVDPQIGAFVQANRSFLNGIISPENNDLFEYFGLRTTFDRYLLKDPQSRLVFETPQFFFLRVACGLAQSVEDAAEFYELISSFEYMPSTPTLFNSATVRPQMSSCYLLDSPVDSLDAIYDRYKDVALLSKFAGGIGLSYSRIRCHGSLIRGTNGKSNGIIPFLKTLDSSVSAVNQGGKRKGAACIYLETWHADIVDFLKLRDNTGDDAMRTHNLNIANWVPDLFMRRVENDETWSLFDPKEFPELVDLYGKEFEDKYESYERAGLAKSTVSARDLYADMMRCLAQTGNGWMTFKDPSNAKANQTGKNPQNVIHLSNLCTEILEVTSVDEAAVCNLGSINLGRYVNEEGTSFDYERMRANVKIAVKYLDRVVDINYYPIPAAQRSNHKWRPVGLGVFGLQDVFFKLNLPFDCADAREISCRIQEEIYYAALETSMELAREHGPFTAFDETKTADGILQFDLWNATPTNPGRWAELKAKIKQHGLRNSLLIAIAPTATIASICGAYECIEPQISNLFKRETLSGEFLQINTYLVKRLKDLGLWNESIRNQIKAEEGSIQGVEAIPESVKQVFRTVWEVPMRALLDMAADRGAYIDQSQSLNLFIESPTIGKLSSMYNYAWKKGLKTTYYLRSRAATRINKATLTKPITAAGAVACSLDNPESCEACQ